MKKEDFYNRFFSLNLYNRSLFALTLYVYHGERSLMDLNYTILIVDDVVENIQVAMGILKEDNYNFAFARSGEEALELMSENDFDLLLLDVMMPGINGFDVCRRMQADAYLREIPVIFLTAKADPDSMSEGFDAGGVDYITKPFHANELLARVRTHLQLYRAKKILQENNISLQVKMEAERRRIMTELEATQKEMIYVLMGMVESLSDETGSHIRRVSEISRFLAQQHPALTEDDAEMIFHAAPMHDVGKLSIPSEILHKADKLTPEEFEIMKSHTSRAHKYLKIPNRKIMKAADVIAYEHHEKWDGSGYPRGLKGEDIHPYARVVALADVFDALISKRTYKEGWGFQKAVSYIEQHKGKHFDPTIVEVFLAYKEEIRKIAQV